MMKKLILFVALAAVSTGLYAQKAEWGVKAGLNLATMSNWDESYVYDGISLKSNAKMIPNFHVGVFVEIPLSNAISFQPELLYSQQGANIEIKGHVEEVSGKAENKIRFNYIHVPLIVKFRLVENLAFNVGPQFGFVTKAKEEISGDGEKWKGNLDSDDYESFDVSAALGLSYQFCEHFDVSARYNLGLTKMLKDEDAVKTKNNVIQLSLGYRF